MVVLTLHASTLLCLSPVNLLRLISIYLSIGEISSKSFRTFRLPNSPTWKVLKKKKKKTLKLIHLDS